jgi:hypothetical protein
MMPSIALANHKSLMPPPLEWLDDHVVAARPKPTKVKKV